MFTINICILFIKIVDSYGFLIKVTLNITKTVDLIHTDKIHTDKFKVVNILCTQILNQDYESHPRSKFH